LNKLFSDILRQEWGAFYWANATGACDSEARFVRGERRPKELMSAALREYDRLVGETDNHRRRLPYDFWDAA
jgi:hypothetical protein